MRHRLSRRSAIKVGVGALGTSVLPGFGRFGRALGAPDPHFLLHVCIAGGVDPTYFFDARPLAMTDAGIVQNYLYKTSEAEGDMERGKRIVMEGSNGTRTLRTTLTEPLMPFKDDITILNGVVMNGGGIEGHGQNMYTLFTGQTVGGFPSFVPMIGQSRGMPIESVHVGGWKGDGNQAPSNFGGSVQIESYGGAELFQDTSAATEFVPEDPAAAYLLKRYLSHSNGNDAFALGCKALHAGLSGAPRLSSAIREAADTSINTQNDGALIQALMMTHRLFSGGVAGAVTIMMDRDMGSSFDIDAHDRGVCSALPTSYEMIVTDLADMLNYLKTTEFSPGKSLLDVTTVMISSEFGRTYRGASSGSIWTTGTEHNQLINSLVFLGKAIKPGQIIGSSDMDTVDNCKPENISGAHKQLTSPEGGFNGAPMGRPFDFNTGLSVQANPEQFDITNYLTIQSVNNTLLKLFDFGDDKLFRDPTGLQFPTIAKWLLKTT